MSQRERLAAQRTGAERVLFDVVRRKRIAPIHIQREGVQGPRIADRAGQCRDTVLVDRRDRVQHQRWCHVVHLDRRCIAARFRIVISHRSADRVGVAGCTRRIVVQVLMRKRKRLAARGACTKRVLLDVIRRKRIAPVHVQRERVQRTRIADRSGQCGHAVLVDRRHGIQRQRGRHVVDRDPRTSEYCGGVIVADGNAGDINVRCCRRRIIIKVLVADAEVSLADG